MNTFLQKFLEECGAALARGVTYGGAVIIVLLLVSWLDIFKEENALSIYQADFEDTDGGQAIFSTICEDKDEIAVSGGCIALSGSPQIQNFGLISEAGYDDPRGFHCVWNNVPKLYKGRVILSCVNKNLLQSVKGNLFNIDEIAKKLMQ